MDFPHSASCTLTSHLDESKWISSAEVNWTLAHYGTSADTFLHSQQGNRCTTRWQQLHFPKSNTYIPELCWSWCRTNVSCESIKGMFRAAGLHLGPGINAATGRKENTSSWRDRGREFLLLYLKGSFQCVCVFVVNFHNAAAAEQNKRLRVRSDTLELRGKWDCGATVKAWQGRKWKFHFWLFKLPQTLPHTYSVSLNMPTHASHQLQGRPEMAGQNYFHVIFFFLLRYFNMQTIGNDIPSTRWLVMKAFGLDGSAEFF